jgi:hypothetical protein
MSYFKITIKNRKDGWRKDMDLRKRKARKAKTEEKTMTNKTFIGKQK